jgi:hypothetical protein
MTQLVRDGLPNVLGHTAGQNKQCRKSVAAKEGFVAEGGII